MYPGLLWLKAHCNGWHIAASMLQEICSIVPTLLLCRQSSAAFQSSAVECIISLCSSHVHFSQVQSSASFHCAAHMCIAVSAAFQAKPFTLQAHTTQWLGPRSTSSARACTRMFTGVGIEKPLAIPLPVYIRVEIRVDIHMPYTWPHPQSPHAPPHKLQCKLGGVGVP